MSENQQIPLVKRELRQLSQVYQAECNKYQEKFKFYCFLELKDIFNLSHEGIT